MLGTKPPRRPVPLEPAWVRDARESLAKVAEDRRQAARRSETAIIARAQRARSPVGRFLRTKYGKQFKRTKREKRWISVPLVLDTQWCAEAEDVGMTISRFYLVLAALGAAVWPAYRARMYRGEDGAEPIELPQLVKYILENAAAPKYEHKAQPHLSAWQRDVHNKVLEQRRSATVKKLDTTTAVLRGAGGKP